MNAANHEGLRTIADHENAGGPFGKTACSPGVEKNLVTRSFGVGCFNGKILSIRSHPFLLREELVLMKVRVAAAKTLGFVSSYSMRSDANADIVREAAKSAIKSLGVPAVSTKSENTKSEKEKQAPRSKS